MMGFWRDVGSAVEPIGQSTFEGQCLPLESFINVPCAAGNTFKEGLKGKAAKMA
jgi:hypothetical protein